MMTDTLKFIFSVDVDWIPGSEQGVAGLFDFCDRFSLPATYFVAGRFGNQYPEIIREIVARGDDLGSHGWEHGLEPSEDFRLAPRDAQRNWILQSTEALAEAGGHRPTMFRAPNLSLNEVTIQVLEELGYELDSSVPSRRFDLGLGAVSYTRYFTSPTEPYHPSSEHLGRVGESKILEVPPSSFIIPMNMSGLRMFGSRALLTAARLIRGRGSVLVFYSHPAEFVQADRMQLAPDESVRYRRGVGPHNFALLERFVRGIFKLGYAPIHMRELMV